MLKDFLELIWNKADAAVRPKELEIADPRNKHFLMGENHFTVEVPPAPRRHVITTLPDLLDAVKAYGDQGTLWHNDRQITLVIDDDDRRETVTMPLVLSQHWLIVSKLGEYLTQQSFLKLLRTDLAGVVPDSLRPAISRIEVATSSGQKNEINPGRERGSREFACDLANSSEIPETFQATLSVYANAGLRQTRSVKLSLDYTLPPKEITFSVRALPDELEIAMQNAQAELHELLVQAVKIPVFCGTP
jgi:hypothetical protein